MQTQSIGYQKCAAALQTAVPFVKHGSIAVLQKFSRSEKVEKCQQRCAMVDQRLAAPGHEYVSSGKHFVTPVHNDATPGNVFVKVIYDVASPGSLHARPGNEVVKARNEVVRPGKHFVTVGNKVVTPVRPLVSIGNKFATFRNPGKPFIVTLLVYGYILTNPGSLAAR